MRQPGTRLAARSVAAVPGFAAQGLLENSVRSGAVGAAIAAVGGGAAGIATMDGESTGNDAGKGKHAFGDDTADCEVTSGGAEDDDAAVCGAPRNGSSKASAIQLSGLMTCNVLGVRTAAV